MILPLPKIYSFPGTRSINNVKQKKKTPIFLVGVHIQIHIDWKNIATDWQSKVLNSCVYWLYSLKTNWLKQPISLFIMWTTIILVKSTNNLVFLTNFIVEPILSLVHPTQSLLHLNHNSVSLTNIMVVHFMNNKIGISNFQATVF